MANNNDDDQKQIAELINFTVESAAAQLESTNNDLINLNSSSLDFLDFDLLFLMIFPILFLICTISSNDFFFFKF
jgi:hypothetical protein